MVHDTLIKNGMVLTMVPGQDVIKDGAVLIQDGAIAGVGPGADFSGIDVKETIDGGGRIIMPGLINCHTHLPMTMFRGLADDLPLDVWLNEHIFPAEASQVNPASVEQWTAHACKEMLLSGTTTCCDGYFHEQEVAGALHASGMRAVTGQGVIDFPAPGVPDPEENVTAAIDFVKTHQDRYPRLTPSIFCHSPYTCSKKTLTAAKKAATELGVLFQIHVAETCSEKDQIQGLNGRSIIQYLDDLALLDEKTLLVHAVWIDDKDIAVIKKSGAGVAHCPESNMKLASGISPVPKLIDSGVRVGLGTDGCASNNDLDLFSEMDTAAKLHKVALLDPCVMDARTCLEAVTCHAAAALGLGHLVGTIESGKQADIILVDIDTPHMVPLHNPYSSLVYAARGSDVSHVMVDGITLVANGKLI